MQIRLKLALLFTSATLVLLLGAGALFVGGLRSGLQHSMDDSLRSRADEIVAELDQTTAGDEQDTALILTDGTYGQILAADGTVLAETTTALDGPLLSLDQVATAVTRTVRFDDDSPLKPSARANKSDRFRVFAEPTGRAGIVVAVTTSRGVVDEAVERAAKQLLLVGTVVLLMAGPGAWLLTRSALSPVERMRAQAAQLQTADAGAGLTVPASRDEIARLGETFNALLARLHSALEHERAFVADAGHELRTPLTVLRGELELARRPGRSVVYLRETVEIAAEETERLIQLAEDLLVLARTEQELPTRFEPVALAELAAAAAAAARPAAGRRDVTIVVEGAGTAAGDPQRLRQALDNLLTNAIRFSPAGSSVRVQVLVADGTARLVVTDSGPGFGPDFLPVAFERFRRGDPARTRAAGAAANPTGAGLGLAIVRSILLAHGGTATAADLDPGAAVTLRWPAERASG